MTTVHTPVLSLWSMGWRDDDVPNPTNIISSSVCRCKCRLKFSWTVPWIPRVEAKAGLVSGVSHKIEITQRSDTGTQKLVVKVVALAVEASCRLLCMAFHCFICVLTACQTKLFPNADIWPAASPGHCHALCTAHPRCTYLCHFSYARYMS